MSSRAGRRTSAAEVFLAIVCRRSLAACEPSSRSCASSVVSGGSRMPPTRSGSWNETSARSSGMRSPAARTALTIPSANVSPPATNAVGGSGAPSSSVAAASALSADQLLADPHERAVGDAGVGDRGVEAEQPLAARGHDRRAADVGDAPVAVTDQMLDQEPDPLAIGEHDAGRVRLLVDVREEHERDAQAAVVPAVGRHHHAAGAMREQRAQGLPLLARVAVRVHHEHLVAGALEHVLRGLHDEPEEGDGDVGDDDADEGRDAGAQGTRHAVGLVAQARRRRPHLAARGLAHRGVLAQGARGGRDRDAGRGGDILEPRSAVDAEHRRPLRSRRRHRGNDIRVET